MTDQELEQLRQLFEVMERLRAPGGCPWDRAQSHKSLLPYLLEETYEAIHAIEEGGPEEVAEELGDLLVEVAMHVAIARESGGFGIGEVAARARGKMVSRHPHVFGGASVEGVDQVLRNWEELKRREKPHRESNFDGIPEALPALALAGAVLRRRPQELGDEEEPGADAIEEQLRRLRGGELDQAAAELALGELLLAVVALARTLGVDAEAALRRSARARRAHWRQAEVSLRGRAGDAGSG
ncbi:MAG: MazG family protein [Candidatus Dormibacteria bacterium]